MVHFMLLILLDRVIFRRFAVERSHQIIHELFAYTVLLLGIFRSLICSPSFSPFNCMMGICFSVYSTSSSFFQCNRENEILFISFGTHDANNLILVARSTSNNIVLQITKWPEDKITIIVHVTDVLAGVPQPMGNINSTFICRSIPLDYEFIFIHSMKKKILYMI